jgi:hypothetical protein
VHPLCEFCRECFFSGDELYPHMREQHEECFVCKRLEVRDQQSVPRFLLSHEPALTSAGQLPELRGAREALRRRALSVRARRVPRQEVRRLPERDGPAGAHGPGARRRHVRARSPRRDARAGRLFVRGGPRRGPRAPHPGAGAAAAGGPVARGPTTRIRRTLNGGGPTATACATTCTVAAAHTAQ